jgi:hypothetical protein
MMNTLLAVFCLSFSFSVECQAREKKSHARPNSAPAPKMDASKLASLLESERQSVLNSKSAQDGFVEQPPDTIDFNRKLYVTSSDIEKMNAAIVKDFPRIQPESISGRNAGPSAIG